MSAGEMVDVRGAEVDARTIYDIACIRSDSGSATREDVDFRLIALRNLDAMQAVAELVAAVREYAGSSDDPDIGWRGTGASDPDTFKCERCHAEHKDCFQIPHTPYCRAMRLVAALAAFQVKP